MAMTRRALLRLAALGPLGAVLPRTGACAAAHGPWLLSAWDDERRRHHVGGFAPDGARRALPSDFRGHGVAVGPASRAVLFARRPGEEALLFDWREGRALGLLEAPPERRYTGHGAFAADGRRLYSGEQDADTAQGVIGIWDVARRERVGEWVLDGIEPHELLPMPDGRLAVALGGISTRADTGRRRLDSGIDSSLLLLDARDGRELARHRLPDARQSLRHLAVAPDGLLAVVCQHQDGLDAPGLAVLAPGAAGLVPLEAPPEALAGTTGYCGSVALDGVGRVALVSATRGDRVLAWDVRRHAFLGAAEMTRPCGTAWLDDAFTVSNELGELRAFDTALRELPARRRVHPGTRWDNHLAVAG